MVGRTKTGHGGLGSFKEATVIRKMVDSKECWEFVAIFAKDVLQQKEDSERVRRGENRRAVVVAAV